MTDKLSLSVLHVNASALQSYSFRGRFTLVVPGNFPSVVRLECDEYAAKIHNKRAPVVEGFDSPGADERYRSLAESSPANEHRRRSKSSRVGTAPIDWSISLRPASSDVGRQVGDG